MYGVNLSGKRKFFWIWAINKFSECWRSLGVTIQSNSIYWLYIYLFFYKMSTTLQRAAGRETRYVSTSTIALYFACKNTYFVYS